MICQFSFKICQNIYRHKIGMTDQHGHLNIHNHRIIFSNNFLCWRHLLPANSWGQPSETPLQNEFCNTHSALGRLIPLITCLKTDDNKTSETFKWQLFAHLLPINTRWVHQLRRAEEQQYCPVKQPYFLFSDARVPTKIPWNPKWIITRKTNEDAKTFK